MVRDHRKEKLYDELWHIADDLLKKYDPCKLDEHGSCIRGVNCCVDCKYLTDTGCSIKCLSCKLWLCDKVKLLYPDLAEKMQVLINIAHKHNLAHWRTPKSKVIK